MYDIDMDSTYVRNNDGRPGIDVSLIKKVKAFYESNGNSCMSPGKRNTIKLTVNGVKEVSRYIIFIWL